MAEVWRAMWEIIFLIKNYIFCFNSLTKYRNLLNIVK